MSDWVGVVSNSTMGMLWGYYFFIYWRGSEVSRETVTNFLSLSIYIYFFSFFFFLYVVVGELAVKEVEYSKTTKKLLLCLQTSLTRSG